MSCVDYGAEEETAVNNALASTLAGATFFSSHTCSDSGFRRRQLLVSSITIDTEATVRDAAYDGASKAAIADIAQNTLAESVASGDLHEAILLEIMALDPSSPLRSVSSLSATSPPTPAPTPAAANEDDDAGFAVIVLVLSLAVGSLVLLAAVGGWWCLALGRKAQMHAQVHTETAPQAGPQTPAPAPVALVPEPITLVPTGVVRQSVITTHRDSAGRNIVQEHAVAADSSAGGRPAQLPQGSILRVS